MLSFYRGGFAVERAIPPLLAASKIARVVAVGRDGTVSDRSETAERAAVLGVFALTLPPWPASPPPRCRGAM